MKEQIYVYTEQTLQMSVDAYTRWMYAYAFRTQDAERRARTHVVTRMQEIQCMTRSPSCKLNLVALFEKFLQILLSREETVPRSPNAWPNPKSSGNYYCDIWDVLVEGEWGGRWRQDGRETEGREGGRRERKNEKQTTRR